MININTLQLYWHPDIATKLQNLSKTIINKFRRRKRKTYKWDLSVATLKQWLLELDGIQPQSVIEQLQNELEEYIIAAQKIPPPDPLHYNLCSTLLNDLALQIPRFAWKSQQFAQDEHGLLYPLNF